ncbi:MAG: winged helix-turn-helix transcriptional regulator [Planctomycetes bacterium]|nr:winged helix-turn-helix transcriptional regulator [Planctomycetota bacterium]
MAKKHDTMSPQMLERVAGQFRALAEPSRLQLMNLLFDRERTVGELVEASGLSLANASKHLGLLHRAGWVTRRKDGLNVVYALADERTFGLCELMCDRVRELAAAEATFAKRGGG